MNQLSINECLEILGLKTYESKDQLKKHYKSLANKHHPDKGGDVEEFKKINQAYTTILEISPQKTKTTTFSLDITFEESLIGAKINTHLGILDIPAGITDNAKISFNGSIIEIKVLKSSIFKREKLDIYCSMSISSLLAITGGTFEFIGPSGNMNSIYIPSLTDNGTILKLEGYGFPHINKQYRLVTYILNCF